MILQHIADGILSGAVVSLGAIGLSFTMKMLRFANFSHSELLTWGAYSALIFVSFFSAFGGMFDANFGPLSFGLPLILALVAACAATAVIAYPGQPGTGNIYFPLDTCRQRIQCSVQQINPQVVNGFSNGNGTVVV